MKNASRVMYLIGRIFNIVELVGFVVMAVLGIVFIAIGSVALVQDPENEQALAQVAAAIPLLVLGIIYAIICLVVLILATKASKKIASGSKEKGPQIMMIVIGAISFDVFYLLGGIFGLVSAASD